MYIFFFSSDGEIAFGQNPKDIVHLAGEVGIISSEVNCYGSKKAKISLKILNRFKHRPDGKLIVVSG